MIPIDKSSNVLGLPLLNRERESVFSLFILKKYNRLIDLFVDYNFATI